MITDCYYKINPYDLENMEYTSPEDINNFIAIYMARDEIKNNTLENTLINYYNLIIECKAIEEITASIENL
jgi:hypothetical protein